MSERFKLSSVADAGFPSPITVVAEKPGSSSGTAQRGCCRNWGESTEDDEFEETARRQRLAESGGKGENEIGKEGGDGPVTQQPATPPPMTTATSTNVTKASTDETK